MDKDHPDVISRAERIMICERALLQALCYDLCYDNPYSYISDICSVFRYDRDILTIARMITNDSYLLPLCLQNTPDLIAAGCCVLSCRIFNRSISVSSTISNENASIIALFDQHSDIALDIALQVMELYYAHL